ncbi:ABC transporter ATP-binding protein [Actinopolymorpha sp. B9G3]|uniref:ABC transporter ATP-binding protein n=1 Tax=Actinopolymorpha sp. B9G3 TaxID=3158970 RepID=UPI0032D90A9B
MLSTSGSHPDISGVDNEGDQRVRRSVVAATVAMLPRVSLPLTIAVAVATVVEPLLGFGFMLAVGHLVAQIPTLVGGQDSDWASALALVAGIYVVQQALASVAALADWRLGQLLNHHLDDRVIVLLQAPSGIAHLEDSRIRDLAAEVADGLGAGWWRPAKTPAALRNLASGGLGLVLAFGVVIWLQWWLGLLLAAAACWAQYSVTRDSLDMILGFSQSSGETEFRRLEYERDVAVSPPSAKEVRLFGFASWALDRWETRLRRVLALDLRNIARVTPSVVLSVIALCVVTAGGFAWAAVELGRGELGLAAATVVAQAVLAPLAQFGPGGQAVINLTLCAKPVRSLLVLEGKLREQTAPVPGTGESPPSGSEPTGSEALPRGDIRLENVSFRYPGSDVDVLHDLSLTIPAGTSLAVVGLNGAGKTTLVKLLCRFYEPTKGRITVDGKDLSGLQPDRWQRRVAAIFSDFARYPASARDNVGFGDLSASTDRIEDAAERAGAADLLSTLPAGWDTVLSREFTDGTDLSGGQWQRVALSRALLAADAGATLLVLDEPAANLDVRAEADLNERILRGFQRVGPLDDQGRLELQEIAPKEQRPDDDPHEVTTVVISHRFSTVRRADRICVLDAGRLIEDGTHDDLVAAGGRYAELFHLQAERFAG